MRSYPALEITSANLDILYGALDDFAPTAIDERDDAVRAFFATTDARDRACAALSDQFTIIKVDVPDEDWAVRSQQSLTPITVGRITVRPSAQSPITVTTNHLPPIPDTTNPQSPIPNHLTITITPSMGFGTGHHATTRMCLAALQEIDLSGSTLLDVGTGSGVLAIAADRLGAARAVGIDSDPDAIESARENLSLNPETQSVTFEVSDLAAAPLPPADVVTANLTGALLARSAGRLWDAVRSGGTLILSGLMRDERDEVCRAYGKGTITWEASEDEWVGLAVKKP